MYVHRRHLEFRHLLNFVLDVLLDIPGNCRYFRMVFNDDMNVQFHSVFALTDFDPLPGQLLAQKILGKGVGNASRKIGNSLRLKCRVRSAHCDDFI